MADDLETRERVPPLTSVVASVDDDRVAKNLRTLYEIELRRFDLIDRSADGVHQRAALFVGANGLLLGLALDASKTGSVLAAVVWGLCFCVSLVGAAIVIVPQTWKVHNNTLKPGATGESALRDRASGSEGALLDQLIADYAAKSDANKGLLATKVGGLELAMCGFALQVIAVIAIVTYLHLRGATP